MSNLQLKRMSECSFQTMLDVWNEGFQGYFVDMTLSLERFLTRISSEGVLPQFSFVAFVEDEAVGFLLNGIRSHNGHKVAWNAGTGIIPAYRGKGVGRCLLNAAVELYKAEGVEIATLEAIINNYPAISLYKDCGYEVVDELTFLQTDDDIRDFEVESFFKVQSATLREVSGLKFYPELMPWQHHWQSLARTRGEALIISDEAGVAVGYALFKQKLDSEGNLADIGLCQCEVAPDRRDAADIVAHALQAVFLTEPGEYRRSTDNFRKSNQLVLELLKNAGFSTFIEQVHMIRTIQ
jgi:ribosomal protein S18 acetylase RimI-like enzyme